MKKTKHHLIPKSRKHDYKHKQVCETSRVLILWDNRHENWHFLFNTMTLDEIIITLNRVRRIKFGSELKLNSNEHY